MNMDQNNSTMLETTFQIPNEETCCAIFRQYFFNWMNVIGVCRESSSFKPEDIEPDDN
jgi:hypothetical protein